MRDLTAPEALAAVNEVLVVFSRPENMTSLKKVILECEQMDMDSESRAGEKVTRLAPIVQGLIHGVMTKYGFSANEVVPAVMQIQVLALNSPSLQKRVNKLMDAFNGNFGEENVAEDEEEMEVCD